jgi:nitrate reductase NapAB chaperone NapD
VGVVMPVSSLLVHTAEPMTSKVASRINELKRASVSRVFDSEIIAITETTSRASDREVWESIERIPGVLGLSLVYHNYEDLNEEKE